MVRFPNGLSIQSLCLILFCLTCCFSYLVWIKNAQFDEEFIGLVSNGPSNCVSFVLAHPDDESMFMTPFLEYLKDKRQSFPELHLHMLTLSTGNFQGKGQQRRRELEFVCNHYMIDCNIINDPLLQDGKDFWDTTTILHYVRQFLVQSKCNFIVTFDQGGVSGHPNHISVYRAMDEMKKEQPYLVVWKLVTVNTLVKYTPFLGPLLGLYRSRTLLKFTCFKVLDNMTKHLSQMRPHVYLWSFFSAYAYRNTFEEL